MMTGPDAFCRSYGAAVAAGDGDALAAHYLLPYYSFTLGEVHCFADRATARAACRDQIARFGLAGLGHDIRMAGHRVEEVAPGVALCHITWAIRPANGVPGWEWTNVYGYRVRAGGEGGGEEGFEFNISDNEIAGILARVPDFYRPRG